MPNQSRLQRDARLSFIARRVYGATPIRPWGRSASPLRVSAVTMQHQKNGSVYLGVGDIPSPFRVAPNAVQTVADLLRR